MKHFFLWEGLPKIDANFTQFHTFHMTAEGAKRCQKALFGHGALQDRLGREKNLASPL